MNLSKLVKAREDRGWRKSFVNQKLGWKGRAYYIKEKGDINFSLDDVKQLCELFQFSAVEYIEIFHDGICPFRDYRLTENGEIINVESAYESE